MYVRNVCHNVCAQFLVPTKLSYVWERKTTNIRNELYGRVLVQLAPNIPDFMGSNFFAAFEGELALRCAS
jgi:hypothetical protein